MSTAKPESSEEIWERIRKLEALGRSENPHEADTARRIASDLRRKHGIDPGLAPDVAIDAKNLVDADEFPWSSVLAYSIAEAHGCLCLVRSRPHGEGINLRLAGSREDRIAATEAYYLHLGNIRDAYDARTKSEVAGGWNAREAWALAEAVAAGGRMRSAMPEDVRSKRLAAAHAAVMARRVAK